MSLFEHISAATEYILRQVSFRPQVGIILGSGLGALIPELKDSVTLPYSEIPGFLGTSVPGHPGQLVIGTWEGGPNDEKQTIPIVILQGRIHLYEGHTLEQVTFPTRVLCSLGIRALILTNAAGGIRQDLKPGDLMMITDHLNLSGTNPLLGSNDSRLGPRFPDLSQAYSPPLQQLLRIASQESAITLHEGVYAWLCGPTYETPAEVRMLRVLGADAVGMSTVPEVIVAAHMRVPVAAISCITNPAASQGGPPLSHSDIAHVAQKASHQLATLISHILPTASLPML